MKKKKRNYSEGDCIAVPLRDGGFGRVVVARMDNEGGIFGYFFGPKFSQTPESMEDIQVDKAVLIGFFGDPGIIGGEWRIIGALPKWSRSEWPLTPLYREDRKADKAWISTYDEKTLTILTEQPVPVGEGMDLPYDRLMGYGAAEIRLSKILNDDL